ncbi:Rieske (2Fe-2S) domain protein [Frankia sp. AiPs1]|uniref:aromatic ring-hydroxylating oxygenase subunit alpha n=1 Tax=Frankia sp. AiPa1 TaxID=573492 RepID=UPI00202B8D0A|nr:aromatic ring-hydroxylating dioxygenase subunit alpha [Frankia sp. AiPa1]MCL9762126.1 aromatic ring-hydroxylating dioxygenase subunit alpha [Frankia sp. AiPa1]
MTTSDAPSQERVPDGIARGQHFYQRLLDDETRPVPESLRAVSAGYTEPGGIAPTRYFDPEFHRREVEKVWGHTWQMACREEQIPEVGDSIVYDIADWSLIVLRTAPDDIRAYHNSCLHRGTQLRTKGGPLSNIRCPFHGFTWNLDGTLNEIPSAWDFPHIDRAGFCLPQAQVATWGGFVFVNIDRDAAPLDEYLETLPWHFAQWPLEDRFLKAHIVRVMPCNWKVALEAFIEAYHTMATHPQLLPTAADSLSEYDVYGHHVSRMITAVGVSSDHLEDPPDDLAIVRRMLGSRDAEVTIEPGENARSSLAARVRKSLSARTGRDYSSVSDAELLDGIEYLLFPNFMPWAGLLTSFAYRFRPNGNDPESCVIDIMVLEPLPEDGVRPPAAPTRVLRDDESWTSVPELGVFGRVFNQDGAAFGRIQRGLRASIAKSTTLALYQESRIRHFHAALETYMA